MARKSGQKVSMWDYRLCLFPGNDDQFRHTIQARISST